jgi:hypothetical protein
MNIHIYGDISEAVMKYCFNTHGGTKFLGIRFPNAAAKKEHERIMKLPLGEIFKYV